LKFDESCSFYHLFTLFVFRL
jgi:hypothetical protein